MNKTFSFLLTLLVMSLLLVPAAFAQETDTVVRLDQLIAPWLELIIGVAVSVLTALGAFLTVWIRQRTGLQIDFLHRDTFQTALNNASGFVLAKAETVQIDTRSPVIRQAVQMVNEGARDAVRHFGITEEEISKRIIAKLGLNQPTNTSGGGSGTGPLNT